MTTFERLLQAWNRWVWITILRLLKPQVRVTVDKLPMYVDVRDRVIGSLLFLNGDYEREIRELIGNMPLQGRVCVDIGANIGLHTLLMAQGVGASGKVIAFEPEPRNFSLLERNVRINALSNVTLSNKALGIGPGTAYLNLNAHNWGDHRVSASPRRQFQALQVEMSSLDEELARLVERQDAIQLIKIDIQGREFDALQGMANTLKKNPGLFLILEVGPAALRMADSSATALLDKLGQLGFTGWEVQQSRVMPLAPSWAYELIREGKDTNILLSKDRQAMAELLNRSYGYRIAA